jgi:hypothetical protein
LRPRRLDAPGAHVLGCHAVLLFEQRQQPVPVQLLGRVKIEAHGLGKGLIALGNDVKQVTHRHNIAQHQTVALVDEQL